MKLIPNALSRGVARQALLTEKNAPTILFGAGLVGMIGATVLACRATLKAGEVLEKHEMNVKATEGEDYPSNERKKDLAVIYGRTTVDMARLYAPSIVLGAASVVMLTKSHGILMRRNAALTAAYVAVDEAFKRYRSRVVEKYGEEEDMRLMFSHEEVDVLNERGKLEKKVQVDPDAPSMYARFFDEYSRAWSKDPEINLAFLRAQQQWLNNLLQARGHVFLNEAYDELGMDRTQAGQVVGWILSEDGDNFIDLGINGNTPALRDFINGREGSILLDFNVDGIIFDKLPSQKRRSWKWQSS